MNIEDGIKVLQEKQGEHLNECIIPSLDKKVNMRPMSVGEFKTVAKTSIDSPEDLDKMLSALLCSLSDDKIDLGEITETDKVSLVYQIRSLNSKEPLQIKLKCMHCEHEFIHEPKEEHICKPIKFETDEINYEEDGLKLNIKLKIPSVKTNMHFGEFFKKHIESLSDETEIAKYGIYLGEYELGYAAVDDIIINESDIGYKNATIEEKLRVIASLPNKALDLQYLKQFIEKNYKLIDYGIYCPECKKSNNDVLGPDNFFFS